MHYAQHISALWHFAVYNGLVWYIGTNFRKNLLPPYSGKRAGSYETPVPIYQATWHHIPDDYVHRHVNLELVFVKNSELGDLRLLTYRTESTSIILKDSVRTAQ
jgi:hypothetical protein